MVTIVGPASSRGRNPRNIADRAPDGVELGVVVSNSADASVLDRTDEHGTPSEVVECGDDEVRESHEERILDILADYDFDFVCFDGCMRVLTSTFLDAIPMTLNVHPSLLPAFPGMDAHEQVPGADVKTTGCTVHVINEKVDAGPIVMQEAVPMYTDDDADDPKSCAFYDAKFKAYPRAARWFAEGRVTVEGNSVTVEGDVDAGSSERRVISEDRYDELRCGENPHQDAAVYVDETCDEASIVGVPQLNEDVKGLSYNDYNDADGALNIIRELDEPVAAVIKHTNPVDCATTDTLAEVYADALATDPMSAFGGIAALNRECDAETAELIIDSFKEVVIASGYIDDTLDVLTEKKNLRVLNMSDLGERTETYTEKVFVGRRLVQERDLRTPTLEDPEVVTETESMDEQLETMLFAWMVLKHVKSNGIFSAKRTEMVGAGMGQVSRVDAAELAVMKVEEYAEGKDARGAVMVFDAFFPFPNGVEKAVDAGIETVIQPGGSVNDEDVVAACNERGTVMVLIGQRCFRHD